MWKMNRGVRPAKTINRVILHDLTVQCLRVMAVIVLSVLLVAFFRTIHVAESNKSFDCPLIEGNIRYCP